MAGSGTVLIVMPANNTTLERELAALLPSFERLLFSRVKRPPRTLTADDIPAYAEATLEAAAPFVRERPELVIYGCTAAGFLAGREGNAAISGQLTAAFGAPVVSTAEAMVAILREEDARSVAVLTPYLTPVNAGLRRYLDEAGIGLTVLDSFECATTEALAGITEADVAERALRLPRDGRDALFIACSQLPTLGILAPLRQRLGIPVWSSVAATAWAAERRRLPADAV